MSQIAVKSNRDTHGTSGSITALDPDSHAGSSFYEEKEEKIRTRWRRTATNNVVDDSRIRCSACWINANIKKMHLRLSGGRPIGNANKKPVHVLRNVLR